MENRILRGENVVHTNVPRSAGEQGLVDFKARALKLIADAKKDANRLRRKGYDDGFRQGFDEGKREGLKQVATIFHLAESAAKAREILAAELASELSKIAIMAAEKVIEREVTTQQEIVVDLVKRLAKELAERDHLRIIVNPQDFEIIRAANLSIPTPCEFIPNPLIEAGGCEIELEGETVDARLKTRVKQIWRAIAHAKIH